MAVLMAAGMSARGASSLAVHCWLFGKLVGYWAAGIVLTRVGLVVSEMSVTWVG